ncbi:hypothetical protein ACOMICROBIO_EPCKBFOG_03372 [Vibrio sp. B1FLJ16]|nr:hypothetical protein ACOMICROBIO_EPCKBFOG_03372 [Vibrio sp. B1FLJ16]CAE6934523.1 hypothetical protein ACOMICROBIO_EPCKBFOG_03372 [Vibrio sp. B1FLJ16]
MFCQGSVVALLGFCLSLSGELKIKMGIGGKRLLK